MARRRVELGGTDDAVAGCESTITIAIAHPKSTLVPGRPFFFSFLCRSRPIVWQPGLSCLSSFSKSKLAAGRVTSCIHGDKTRQAQDLVKCYPLFPPRSQAGTSPTHRPFASASCSHSFVRPPDAALQHNHHYRRHHRAAIKVQHLTPVTMMDRWPIDITTV